MVYFWYNKRRCSTINGIGAFAYYKQLQNMQAFGILGFLINIVILGMEVSASASETIAEGHKAEIYKELAEKDILTKGYNRNAYNEDIRHKISGDNTYPVMPNMIRNWMQTLTRPDAGRMY